MKQSLKYVPVLFLLALIVSACGSPAAPTMNAAAVQSTAVAAAFTVVAQTQAAMPTATPLPPTNTPTETPLATNTPPPLPTIAMTNAVLASPTNSSSSSSSSGTDPCANRVLGASPQGKQTTIRIVNETKVPIKLSLYLEETASHGECGYRYYEISKGGDVVISDLIQGCYDLWAWSDAPKGKFNSSGGGCINNDDKWTFEIGTGSIKFVGP